MNLSALTQAATLNTSLVAVRERIRVIETNGALIKVYLQDSSGSTTLGFIVSNVAGTASQIQNSNPTVCDRDPGIFAEMKERFLKHLREREKRIVGELRALGVQDDTPRSQAA